MIDIRKEQILYHGSKGGIKGDISPKSPNPYRQTEGSDFGDAFYMGTDINQAKAVCIDKYDKTPFFYTLKIHFDEINSQSILLLNDNQWLYTIIAHRKDDTNKQIIKNSNFIKQIQDTIKKYDFIIGIIADDRMNHAISEFKSNNLTDLGLKACLQYIDYGEQVAATTKKACSSIEILSYKEIKGFEKDKIRTYTNDNLIKTKDVVDTMKRKYRREGLYYDEIIEKIANNELSINSIFPTPSDEISKDTEDYFSTANMIARATTASYSSTEDEFKLTSKQ